MGNDKDKVAHAKLSEVPEVNGKAIQKAKDMIHSKSLNPVVIGNGSKITQQSLASGTEVLPNSNVLLLTDGELTMPDMNGWTKEDVLHFQNMTGVEVEMKGHGFVSEQSVSPNQKVTKKDKVKIVLSAPEADAQ